MMYRIEYVDGRKCSFTTGRDATIRLLENMDREKVSDVRRVYKNGVSETVMESYERFLKNA